LYFENEIFYLLILNSVLLLQGLILSNALRAQKNIEDEGYTMALNNLRSEVIELRNEGLEKEKILISLVNKVKEDEASFNAQAEIQKNEIEDLRKQLAEAKEKCALAEANREISEYWKNHLDKIVEELRASKERCFEKSLGCVEKIKASFANVGAYSNEDNFIRGDPEGVIEWISGEAEAFEEILSDRGDVCTFSGARGISAILEKAECDHVKTLAQAEAGFSVDDTKDPSAEASLMGEKFYNDIWVNGGREMAHEIMKKSEKDIHDTRVQAKQAEEVAERERRIGIISRHLASAFVFCGFRLINFFHCS
jgi:organic hydroperoxide reductase OsmC/OhrA